MSIVNMRAKYKTSVKEPGIPGLLNMTEDKFLFTPDDPRASVKLDVGFRSIKSHKFSKEGSKQALLNLTQENGGYIFEFNNFSDRDRCRDFVGKVLGKLQTVSSSKHDAHVVSEGPAVAIPNEQLSQEEFDRRVKLLLEDSAFHAETILPMVHELRLSPNPPSEGYTFCSSLLPLIIKK